MPSRLRPLPVVLTLAALLTWPTAAAPALESGNVDPAAVRSLAGPRPTEDGAQRSSRSVSLPAPFFARSAEQPRFHLIGAPTPAAVGIDGVQISRQGASVTMQFPGADLRPRGGPALEGRWHDLRPSTPERLSTERFQSVEMPELWPGITLEVAAAPAGTLKSTWRVRPGADPMLIHWRYSGGVPQLQRGRVHVMAPGLQAPLVESAPVAWQVVRDRRRPVQVAYRIDSRGSVRWHLGDYDRTRELVIDPELQWSDILYQQVSTSGGSAVAWDAGGGLVAAGAVADGSQGTGQGGPSLPATGTQPSYGGGSADGWIARWLPDGRLDWLTYLGGSSYDGIEAIATDGDRIAFAVQTYSHDLSRRAPPGGVSAGPSSSVAAVPDVYVGVLTGDGSTLQLGTYIPSDTYDHPRGLAWADGELLVLAGATRTSTPQGDTGSAQATAGAYRAGVPTAFLTRLSAGGVVKWAAALGTDLAGAEPSDGQAYVEVTGLAVERDGSVLVAGTSNSAGYPTTPGAFQPDLAGGRDAFVTRLRADGSQILASTFFGDNGLDEITTVLAAADGRVLITGDTTSTRLPGTAAGACGRGGQDLFFAELSTTLTALEWGRCVGGSLRDTSGDAQQGVMRAALHASGDVVAAAFTASADFPLRDSVTPTMGGDSDLVVLRVTTGGAVVWASLLGGPDGEAMRGAAAVAGDQIAVTGTTRGGPGFPGEDDAEDDLPAVIGGHAFVSLLRDTTPDPGASSQPSPTPSPVDSPTNAPSPTVSGSPSPSPSVIASRPAGPSGSPMAEASTEPSSESIQSPAPGASPSTSPPSDAPPCHPGTLTVLDPRIVAGAPARVRFLGTPGRTVALEGYSRHYGVTPRYARLRTPVVVPPDGRVDFTVRPMTNTRLRAVDECAATASAVVAVAARLGLEARRGSARQYVFSGTRWPREGQVPLYLYYRTSSGETLRARAVVRDGRWSVSVRFAGTARLSFLVRTRSDVVNLAGQSPARSTLIW